MPNWCNNIVEITGDLDTLKEIQAAAEDGRFLEYLAPIGEWDYEKAVDAWGTKWDIHKDHMHCHLYEDEGKLALSFDSAWSPPTDAYWTGVDRHNVSIKAYYYESGMMFAGKYEDGYDDSYDIDFDNEDWAKDIPEDVIDKLMLDIEYENWKEYQEDVA